MWINSCAGVVQDKDNIHCGDEERFDDLPNGDVLILTEGRGVTGFLQPKGFPSATTAKVQGRPEEHENWLLDSMLLPSFHIENLAGGFIDSRLIKKRTVINFWATWCQPCHKELSEYVESWREFQQAGIDLIAISVDGPQDHSQVRSFVQEYGLPFLGLLQTVTLFGFFSVKTAFCKPSQGSGLADSDFFPC